VGVIQVPLDHAHEYGVMTVDDEHRVTHFAEKPAHPEPMSGRTDVALASMGIYVFGREFLKARLGRDARDAHSVHDFGRNIIPGTIETGRVIAYPFQDVKTRAQAYWRDVGTVDAFYEANLELVYVTPELNLYDEDWPIWTYQEHAPGAKFVLDEDGRRGEAINSIVAGGVIVSGATVRESLLFFNAHVEERSEIYRSVLLPHVRVGKRCRIRRAILDEGCVIPDDTVIGESREADARRFHVTERGVVLVTADMLTAAARQEPGARNRPAVITGAAG
jgi:glucose-1-phosphate adenylyltransferase